MKNWIASALIALSVVTLVSALAPAKGSAPTGHVYRITYDMGGLVKAYEERYHALHVANANIVIDGECDSACTLVTGLVNPARVCVTPQASLGFHSAWERGDNGQPIYSRMGTAVMWRSFPWKVKALVRLHGWDGLSEHPDIVKLNYIELRTVYRACA